MISRTRTSCSSFASSSVRLSTGCATPSACAASGSGGLILGSDKAPGGGSRLLRNLFARKHTGDFFAAAANVQRLGAGLDGDSLAVTARGFVKPEVRVRVRSHLRRVGYRQDLSAMPQPLKALPDRRSRRPANTRIDFVEDQHRRGGFFRENHFKREQEASQLAARSHLHQWARVRPRVRLNMKHDRFTPEGPAGEAAFVLGKPFSLGREPCFFKPQRRQLLLNRGVKKGGGGASLLA